MPRKNLQLQEQNTQIPHTQSLEWHLNTVGLTPFLEETLHLLVCEAAESVVK